MSFISLTHFKFIEKLKIWDDVHHIHSIQPNLYWLISRSYELKRGRIYSPNPILKAWHAANFLRVWNDLTSDKNLVQRGCIIIIVVNFIDKKGIDLETRRGGDKEKVKLENFDSPCLPVTRSPCHFVLKYISNCW